MSKTQIRPEMLQALMSEFDVVFDRFTDDLSRIKGWSTRSIFKTIQILLEAAPELVPSWLLATPEERRAAVITRVNEHVDIPILSESTEEKLIRIIYDVVAAFI